MNNTIEVLLCVECGHPNHVECAIINNIIVYYFTCELCGKANKKDK